MRCRPSLLAAVALLAAAGPAAAFDLQGHRGARGLMPENTLPAFATALTLGVATLELDLALTADGVLMVIHDPVPAPRTTRRAGQFLASPEPPIWHQSRAALAALDVGRIDPADRYARQFPEQQPVDGATVPTLDQVFALARRAGNTAVRFNVEIKTSPLEPDLTAPPERFAAAVIAAVTAAGLTDRVLVQSFDWRALAAIRRGDSRLATVHLTAEQPWLDTLRRGQPGPSPWTDGHDIDAAERGTPAMVRAAGGTVWSPYWQDLTAADLDEAKALGLPVVVWTVNDPAVMRSLIDRGVDGIITDYPDRLRRVMAEAGLPLPAATPVDP